MRKLVSPVNQILLGFVLMMTLVSCTSPDSSENLIKNIAARVYPKGKVIHEEEGKFRIEFDSTGVDFSVMGTYRSIGDFLAITFQVQIEMEGKYQTAVFKRSENKWNPLFETELIDGRVDTIMNLNDDQIDEFIIDDYVSSSAGFDSYQFVYANINGTHWQKIGTLSRRMQGMTAGDYIKSNMSVDRSDGTLLIVESEKSTWNGETPIVTKERIVYQWDPPNLAIQTNESEEQSGAGETESLDAAILTAKDENQIRILVKQGARATSGLPFAFESKNQKLVNDLIESGADKNVALFWAVEFEDTTMVHSLIKDGARITEEASQKEKYYCVDEMSHDGFEVHWNSFTGSSKVAYSNNIVLKKMILGALDGKIYSTIWEDPFTPGIADSDLIRASASGDFAAVEFMLMAGADPNARLGEKFAPCAAKQAGHQQIIDLLVKYGASPCD